MEWDLGSLPSRRSSQRVGLKGKAVTYEGVGGPEVIAIKEREVRAPGPMRCASK